MLTFVKVDDWLEEALALYFLTLGELAGIVAETSSTDILAGLTGETNLKIKISVKLNLFTS